MLGKVTGYQAVWVAAMHKGHVIIRLEGEVGQPDLGWCEPAEFHAIVDLLRNEQPIYFDRQTGQLETLMEPTGETEADDAQLAYLELQRVMQKQEQLFVTLSNILKRRDDTALAAIEKIRG